MTRRIEALPRGDFSPLSCPCPYGAHRFFPIIAQDFSPGRPARRPKVVKADKLYDQTYRGSASRGLQSPFLPVPLSGAHRFLPIIAQDFSPGSSCAPAASHQRKKNIAWDPLRDGRGPTRRPRNKKSSQGHALGAFPPLLIVLF